MEHTGNIIALCHSLRDEELTDLQVNLLGVAQDIIANVMVQIERDKPPVRSEEPLFERGQPVQVAMKHPALDGVVWQRSTVIDVVKTPGDEGYWLYKTPFGSFDEFTIRRVQE